jgi:FKBP-type peptidyl-prolyl cis-trans isomerase
MRILSIFTVAAVLFADQSVAFSLSMVTDNNNMKAVTTSSSSSSSSRRGFLSKAATTAGLVSASVASLQPIESATAAPPIYKLDSGVQYATLKEGKGSYPQPGDIVAIEYTGYLTTGTIFDGTHSEGKQNALLFKLGR